MVKRQAVNFVLMLKCIVGIIIASLEKIFLISALKSSRQAVAFRSRRQGRQAVTDRRSSGDGLGHERAETGDWGKISSSFCFFT